MQKLYSLLSILFCCAIVSMNAQTVYFSEDFENGFPSDWTMTGEWQLTDAAGIASAYFGPADHTMFMGFNDDALVNQNGDNGRVATGPIDLSAVTGLSILTFQSYFPNGDYQGQDETARVHISGDGGNTWSELSNIQVSGFEWLDVQVIIPAIYAGATVHLAFDYDDGNQWNYGWCFDDVKIQDPTIIRDAAVDFLNKESYLEGALVGAEIYPGCIVTNNGLDAITSLDLNVTVNGNMTTETFSGLDISALGGKGFLQATTPYIMESGTADITVSVSNVNGLGDDDDTANDSGGSFSVTSVTPHPDRGVLVEEATGTWCTWCPRGAVYMDAMAARYPGHFVGVAVHNGDPMAVSAYDNGVTSFPGFVGFPSVIFDRTSVIDPSDMETPFLNKITQEPVARLMIGADLDDATNELTVSIATEFLQSAGAGYKLNAVIIEDHVTGTGSGYNQINAYSGGGPGPMDFYTILPSPVPAADMVYDHVGRALLGGFGGVSNSVPDAANPGDSFGYHFDTYTIPANINQDNIQIAALLIAPNGSIANAGIATLEEAIANGLSTGVKDIVNHDMISVSPNPFSGSTNIRLNLESAADVGLQVYNSVGQLVANREYGQLSGAQVLPFNAVDLSEGMYYFHVRVNGQIATHKVFLKN